MPLAGRHDTALVLLHGFCEDSSLWDHIIPHLKFNGNVTTPTLPGFGKTELNRKEFSLADIAATIHAELIGQGIKKYICIGHSLGGYITLELKKKFPDIVTSIGLLHSTAFADNIAKKKARNKLIKFLETNSADKFLATFVPSLFCETNLSRLKTEVEKVIEMSVGIENLTIQAYAAAMRDREDNTKVLYGEKQPLFIAGSCDLSVPKEDSESQILNIINPQNCHMINDTAHMGMYESSSIIIKAINQFTGNNQQGIG